MNRNKFGYQAPFCITTFYSVGMTQTYSKKSKGIGSLAFPLLINDFFRSFFFSKNGQEK